MWVFGYGSLMWDGWQAEFNCTRRSIADLQGHTRTFNKASIKNWGSRQCPGPTLNLAPRADVNCRGYAFEFAETDQPLVKAYLSKREGGFTLAERRARLADGPLITATVPIYENGKNLIENSSTEIIVAMIRAAGGTSGNCVDYVRNVAEQLAQLGVDDPQVNELLQAIDAVET